MLAGGLLRFHLPARLLGIATGLVCTLAFLQCPRQYGLQKRLTFVFLVPGLCVAVFCVSDYLLSRLSQNEAVKLFSWCRHLGLC